MTRSRLVSAIVGVAIVVLVAWIANNTYWDEVVVPVSLRGEARSNAFYAAEQFSRKLGATASHAHVLGTPPQDSIVVLSSWHWNLTTRRRQALESWVANGGRLVVDRSLVGGEESFRQWTGLSRGFPDLDTNDDELFERSGKKERCTRIERRGTSATAAESYQVCDLDSFSFLRSKRPPDWSLGDEWGPQVVRVTVGRGSVTAMNSTSFRYRTFLEGDHARLFVAATQLRRGDQILFLSEDEHPSLLSLMWQEGSPVVVLSLTLIGLALWRGGVRFGPQAASEDRARRSLAEQISGTGQFALRYGGGESLHAAALRALGEAAERRIPGFARLTPDERIGALERLTGFDSITLAGAMLIGARRPNDLRSAVAILEAARRRILTRSQHGTH